MTWFSSGFYFQVEKPIYRDSSSLHHDIEYSLFDLVRHNLDNHNLK